MRASASLTVPASAVRRSSVPERPERKSGRRVGRQQRGVERLRDAARRQRGEHDARHASAPGDVPHAAGQRPELIHRRGRLALERVVLSRLAAAVVGAAAEVAQAGVAAGAAVVDARRGDVADAPAGRAQPRLPLLLVAAARERGVERAGALGRRSRVKARLAPHRNSASVSCGPRSRAVIGSGSRPHERKRASSKTGLIGPPRASPSACSSAPSQPGHTRTSSSSRQIRSPVDSATHALRATLMPFGPPSAT